MLDDLLQANFIELLEMKCLEEINCVNAPNYYRYYRVIIHPIKKLFILKHKVMELHARGEVTLNEEAATSNKATIESINQYVGLLVYAAEIWIF